MAIAAVPNYLGTDFSSASPGLRFGMYLPLWGVNRRTQEVLWQTYDITYEIRGQNQQEREVRKENKNSALKQAARLTDSDKARSNALHLRQKALARTIEPSQLLHLEAIAVAPFTTGLGNEHPLENGFAFLNPHGLPYLPGSGVKGVLRNAARELANGVFGGTEGWTHEAIAFLFGDAAGGDGADGQRGALMFWDVLPQIEGDALRVEIMTPHQSHYLQGKASPHDSGQPNPISFLTVPPKSKFDFVIQCDLPFLARIAPDLAHDGRWKALMQSALKHAFDWLGFGAKTAVGYGAMIGVADQERAQQAARQAERMQAQQEAEARSVLHEGVYLKRNSRNGRLHIEKSGKEIAAVAGDNAEAMFKALGNAARQTLQQGKGVKLNARADGNVLLSVEENP